MPSWESIHAFLIQLPGAEPEPEVVKVRKKAAAYRTRNRRAWADNIARDDEVLVVIRCDPLERAALLQEDPDTFRVTPHYESYDGVIVRVATIDPVLLRELLIDAWRRMAPPAIVRELEEKLASGWDSPITVDARG